MVEPDKDDAANERRRGGRKLAAILWWIAAGLGLGAFTLAYVKTGKVDVTKAILVFAFLMMAFMTQRGLKR